MQKIAILPPGVAERIAAGEVIERPSSVVKELIENCIDAGATQILVHLEEGGKKLIEVIDNGHGMSPEDLVLSVKRHATSKLRTLDDLDRILTLGFRGEALPSIAAVSELSVLSRPQAQTDTFQLTVNSALTFDDAVEKVTFGHFLGSPHGTRIQARGLFSQVPARLKFLKSQGSEVSAVREWMERLALTHPQIAFKLTSDQRTVLNYPTHTTEARIRALLAEGEDYPLLTASANHPELGLKITAHWIQGMSVPHSRKALQIINHRAIKDRLIQQAVLGPFRQALLPGQFPAVLINLELDPARLDVNVHPTKTEVRFLESGKVFHVTQKLIETLIQKNGASGFVASTFFRPSPEPTHIRAEFAPAPTVQTTFIAQLPPAHSLDSLSTSLAPEIDVPLLREAHPFASARFVGLCMDTYILLELDHELILVDQHAAHERIRFEQVRNRKSPMSQLLIPEAVSLDFLNDSERLTLHNRIEFLTSAGFDAEIFGENAVLFRGIPSVWGTQNLKTRLRNLLERLLAPSLDSKAHDASALVSDEVLFERMASEACRSSIRSGDVLSEWQAKTLIEQLFECDHPWNCPHGRPTTVRLPEGRFEEWFQRRAPHSQAASHFS